MRILSCILLTLILHSSSTFAQTKAIKRQLFFLDDKLIEATFTTDIKKLRNNKKVPAWQPAHIVMHFSDSTVISEEIRVQPRGVYRKNNCDIAALMLNFKNPTSPKLSALKKLKLVGAISLI